MAVLSKRTRRSAAYAALSGLALVIIGCSLGGGFRFGGSGREGLAFSHALHYGEEGLDCSSCHADFDSEEDPGMPVLSQCMLCHEEVDAQKPPEKHIATLFDAEVYRSQHLSELSDEVVFSHRAHALDEALCSSCHVGIETSERLDEDMAVSMDDCTSCHTNLGIAAECSTCHSEIREDTAPASHSLQWQRTHGFVFRAGSQRAEDRCDLCHTQRECTTCHANDQPESHTNYWRRRGHGITARMDRATCVVCHREESCDTCHREVRPQSHRGLWGSTKDMHCVSCHIEDRDGGCFVCHTGTPSHAMAATQPDSHVPGMNCRQCHGLSAPLPHVTDGQDCTLCHQ